MKYKDQYVKVIKTKNDNHTTSDNNVSTRKHSPSHRRCQSSDEVTWDT